MLKLCCVSVVLAGFLHVALRADDGSLRSDMQRDVIREAVISFSSNQDSQAGKPGLLTHYQGLRAFARGRLLERKDRLTEALGVYQGVLQLEPHATEVMRMSIPICFKLERTVPALQLIRQALAQEPQQPDLWLRYVQELSDLELHQEAVQSADQALKTVDFSTHPALQAELFAVKASAHESLSHFTKAVEAYQRASALLEDRDRYLEDPYSATVEELPGERAKLFDRLGRAWLRAGQYDQAILAYRQADATRPRQDERLDVHLAEVYLAAKQTDLAMQHVKRALAKKPPGDETYRLLVQVLRQAGKQNEVLHLVETLQHNQPGNLSIKIVLAEQYAASNQTDHAERLYREIMAQEAVGVKDVCAGYLRLLVQRGECDLLVREFELLCRQPQRASWARAMMLALLSDRATLLNMAEQAARMELNSSVRILLVKLAMQSGLWHQAEALLNQQKKRDPKPTEAYLLLCKCLSEQRKTRELIQAAREALENESVGQSVVFGLEVAKAHALLREAESAKHAIHQAKEVAAPGTMDRHKVDCTELYVLHLLGENARCIEQGERLLAALARSPWGRQVRYVLAHAFQAGGQLDRAVEQCQAILSDDTNDAEAAAALAQCYFLQGNQMELAEKTIRQAIELNFIDRHKKNRAQPVRMPTTVNPSYQSTLVAILLRTGRVQEATGLLNELAKHENNSDPWVWLCVGDGYLQRGQGESARQAWDKAQQLVKERPSLGMDLRPSLAARFKHQTPGIIQTGVGPRP